MYSLVRFELERYAATEFCNWCFTGRVDYDYMPDLKRPKNCSVSYS